MPKIKLLPDYIISKIAAGQIIERPAYAIKELVDNAIDAHATHIKIEIEEAGSKKIVVTDNGEGMIEEDLREAYKLHTTSKLSTDVFIGIKTMGFRGEALASIAAVSDLCIRSRTKDSSEGIEISIENGQLKKQKYIGFPQGTQIIIKDLFSDIPARKKFQKSITSEFHLIIKIIKSYIFAHPEITFSFSHNSKTIFHFSADESLEQRVKSLTQFKTYIPVSYSDEYIQLTGFISPPTYVTSDDNRYVSVNYRPVQDIKLLELIREAYKNLIPRHSFPVAILNINIPHQLIDVNIHPRKEYVHILPEEDVFESIKKVLLSALSSPQEKHSDKNAMHSFAADILRSELTYSEKEEKDYFQFGKVYIVEIGTRNITLYDQHAVHERILYEKLIKSFEEKQAFPPFLLQEPYILSTTSSDSIIIEKNTDLLAKLGFEIEPFGKNTFKIISIPFLFQDRDIKTVFTDTLANIKINKHTAFDEKNLQMIIYLACRGAVKAGDILQKEEMKKLILQLQQAQFNTTCPHGRPTSKTFSKKEFNTLFKRT